MEGFLTLFLLAVGSGTGGYLIGYGIELALAGNLHYGIMNVSVGLFWIFVVAILTIISFFDFSE